MNDAYRTPALICPACAAPLREYQNRYCCDECGGMLIEVADFETACLDMSADAKVEISDRAPSTAATPPICPRCERPMGTCRVRVAAKKLGQFSTCDRHGLWFGPGVLAGAFAVIGRVTHGAPRNDPMGQAARRAYGPRDASGGLSIASWRERPRKRKPTLTPVNAYRDQQLRCPACGGDRALVFLGDRYACEGCHGVFVEYAALAALVEEMTGTPWEIPPASGAPGPRTCPICAVALVVEDLATTPIDRCPEHGVWFDPQELEATLQHAVDRPAGIAGWLRKLF